MLDEPRLTLDLRGNALSEESLELLKTALAQKPELEARAEKKDVFLGRSELRNEEFGYVKIGGPKQPRLIGVPSCL